MTKKILLVIVVAGFALPSFGQLKIGIYPTDRNDAFTSSERETVMAEFVKQIKQECNCVVLARDENSYKGMNDVYGYQSSGEVEASQIVAIGKQSGENTCCMLIFRINNDGSRAIEARYIDVKTAEILAIETCNVSTNIKTYELQNIAEKLARNLEKRRKSPKEPIYGNKQERELSFNPHGYVSGYVDGRFCERMDSDDVERLLSSVSPDCYFKYKKGVEWKNKDLDFYWFVPSIMMFFGVLTMTLWCPGEGAFNGDGKSNAVAWAGLGVFCAPLLYLFTWPAICTGIGKCKIKSAIKEYNRNVVGDNIELKLGLSPMGAGLTMNF